MSKRDVPQLVTRWNILESAGVPLEPPDCRVGIDTEKRGTGLTVRAGRDRWRSKIRELRDGRFGFIIAIFIRRDDPGKTIILDAWIGTSWPDTSIDLLEDPAFEEKHPGYYNLPGDSERFFREEVVNNRIINNHWPAEVFARGSYWPSGLVPRTTAKIATKSQSLSPCRTNGTSNIR
jgi:hypothetical protein